MYRLEVNGSYTGSYRTPEEAMKAVEKYAKKFNHKWVIYNQFGKIYAQS